MTEVGRISVVMYIHVNWSWLGLMLCASFSSLLNNASYVIFVLQVECEAMHRRRSNITCSLFARELGLGWRQQCIPSNTALQNYAESIASQSTKNEV